MPLEDIKCQASSLQTVSAGGFIGYTLNDSKANPKDWLA